MADKMPVKLCRYYCRSTEWQCPREALPDSKDGFCICHERRDDKDEKVFRHEVDEVLKAERANCHHFEGFYFPFEMNFSQFVFKKNTYFVEAVFKKSVSFEMAHFGGRRTDFFLAQFWGEQTSFERTEFSGKHTSFQWAEFWGRQTIFSVAQFSGDVTNFSGSQFLGRNASFSYANFSGGATYFCGANFPGKETSFHQAEFEANRTSFSTARIYNRMSFSRASFQSSETELCHLHTGEGTQLIFKDAVFNEGKKNDLTNIDLSKCLFQETKLEYCDLTLCEWDWNDKLLNETASDEEYIDILCEGFKKVRTIEEEEEEKGREINRLERYRQAATSYQMLKNSFYKRRAFREAGIFHYREQECRRKALPWYKQWFYWGLRLSCGYGEKVWNPVGSVLFFWLLFAFLFWQLLPIMPSYYADYHPEPVTFWQAASYSFLHILPLWNLSKWEPASDWTVFSSGLEFLIGAFLIGLFIYVFRRRLER